MKITHTALASLVFEPDELVIISHAAKRVRTLALKVDIITHSMGSPSARYYLQATRREPLI